MFVRFTTLSILQFLILFSVGFFFLRLTVIALQHLFYRYYRLPRQYLHHSHAFERATFESTYRRPILRWLSLAKSLITTIGALIWLIFLPIYLTSNELIVSRLEQVTELSLTQHVLRYLFLTSIGLLPVVIIFLFMLSHHPLIFAHVLYKDPEQGFLDSIMRVPYNRGEISYLLLFLGFHLPALWFTTLLTWDAKYVAIPMLLVWLGFLAWVTWYNHRIWREFIHLWQDHALPIILVKNKSYTRAIRNKKYEEIEAVRQLIHWEQFQVEPEEPSDKEEFPPPSTIKLYTNAILNEPENRHLLKAYCKLYEAKMRFIWILLWLAVILLYIIKDY
ncbi:hypothetical protein PVA45_07730 (plasmid) [Entomospira entomophila]|uniref:Uncharacterized protein n=1 Tax=Entomospira entomophila TaxID=2719988 RepID=A0A968GD45_9SPIO|nr:hypothetical protein [Entomospira entomophilus]NIZ41393.1 hypothetical protein [Entomospira entomophilus]WDI36343.1 hypothetical protein PVA45_07730 [Entomospira entomophilus]